MARARRVSAATAMAAMAALTAVAALGLAGALPAEAAEETPTQLAQAAPRDAGKQRSGANATPQILVVPPPGAMPFAVPPGGAGPADGGAVAPADLAARYLPPPAPTDSQLRSAPPRIDARGAVVSGASIR